MEILHLSKEKVEAYKIKCKNVEVKYTHGNHTGHMSVIYDYLGTKIELCLYVRPDDYFNGLGISYNGVIQPIKYNIVGVFQDLDWSKLIINSDDYLEEYVNERNTYECLTLGLMLMAYLFFYNYLQFGDSSQYKYCLLRDHRFIQFKEMFTPKFEG